MCIAEDIRRPLHLVLSYTAVAWLCAARFWLFDAWFGAVLGPVLLLSAVPLTVHAHYFVSPSRRRHRRSLKAWLALVNGVGAFVMCGLGHPLGLAIGLAVAAATLALCLAAGHVGDWYLDGVRVFQAENHCNGCGYNLTANLSGRCPECGNAAVRADNSCG